MHAYRRTHHICENYPPRRLQGCLALAPVRSGIVVGGHALRKRLRLLMSSSGEGVCFVFLFSEPCTCPVGWVCIAAMFHFVAFFCLL